VRSSSSDSRLAPSCHLLAEQQLRMWLGVGDSADLQFNRVSPRGCGACIEAMQQLNRGQLTVAHLLSSYGLPRVVFQHAICLQSP
jgi:hypothetical protein